VLTAAWHIEFIKLSANGVTAFEGSVIFQDPRELDGFDVGLAASRIAGRRDEGLLKADPR
jgi:hypothetical protein